MKIDIILDDANAILKQINFGFLKNKTVLVTGATGLLGTHFLATLALLNERGWKSKVFGVCHSDPADYTVEIARLGGLHLIDKPTVKTDVALHLSGYAQPVIFTKKPAETIRINTALTHELLDTLRSGGKFLFVSSSEVYSGADYGFCVCEESIGVTSPVYHPRACYIEGKRCGEAITNAYRESGVDAKSARLGITYGPGTRANDQRAMCQFIRQALTEKRIDMKYSGDQAQSFCYIRDAVEMMWQILLHGTYPVYNVGSPFMTSMSEIAKRIAIITGAELHFPTIESEMPGSRGVRMSVAGAEMEFGKLPYVGLEEGLNRTIDWNRGFYAV